MAAIKPGSDREASDEEDDSLPLVSLAAPLDLPLELSVLPCFDFLAAIA